ncbi:MAG: CinA family protein [Bacteroides sp.]|nr:CinA family protein [Bacteroides sp.]MBD5347844.1 CinA family protein [Bacteroides sp.]
MTDTKKDIHLKETAPAKKAQIKESRHVVIYGYTKDELRNIMRHFEAQLPEYVKISISSNNLVTRISLTGVNDGVELLRFKINKFHQTLQDMFVEEVVSIENKSVAQVLGDLLSEREVTIACAESCTGGNIAHNITRNPGSSVYFLGSVVSYSNDVKANVLNVSRSALGRYGAVSREVVTEMAAGVSQLMHTDCAVATSGIAGPDGGTKFKPVGTVWMAAKYGDKIVTELKQFSGDRESVIESATNHVMVMLIKLLRNNYTEQEDIADD